MQSQPFVLDDNGMKGTILASKIFFEREAVFVNGVSIFPLVSFSFATKCVAYLFKFESKEVIFAIGEFRSKYNIIFNF